MTTLSGFDRVLRARAALLGLIVGDALGAAVEGMSAERATEVLDEDMLPSAPDDHPFWPGQAAATTTDDTAQSLLLAQRIIIDGPVVDVAAWTRDLADWVAAEDVAGRGAHIGPSTRQAVLEPGTSGHGSPGLTNGSAMRIVPVGIACSADPAVLVEAVVASGRPAHDSDLAQAAAAAVAAAVAAGIAGADIDEAFIAAVDAAREAATYGQPSGRPPFVDTLAPVLVRAKAARDLSDAERRLELHRIAVEVGTDVGADQSVIVALAVASAESRDPWRAARLGASLGGDTDTQAGIAAAIVGATTGVLAPSTVLARLDRTLVNQSIRLTDALIRAGAAHAAGSS